MVCVSAGVNECVMWSPCQHICHDLPIGYECSCRSGYQLLDGGTCRDVDECDVIYPCSHYCLNRPGGFQCSCADGYELAPDKRGCKLHDNGESTAARQR